MVVRLWSGGQNMTHKEEKQDGHLFPTILQEKGDRPVF